MCDDEVGDEHERRRAEARGRWVAEGWVSVRRRGARWRGAAEGGSEAVRLRRAAPWSKAFDQVGPVLKQRLREVIIGELDNRRRGFGGTFGVGFGRGARAQGHKQEEEVSGH